MSTHVRQQIREAIKQVLTGLEPTGDRVYTGRTRPLSARHEDTLLVYTPHETSSRAFNGNPPIDERPLTIYVEIRVIRPEPPDDDLDAIAALIEAKMWTNRRLGGLVSNMQYVGGDQLTDTSAEGHIGGFRLEYRATYRVPEGSATELADV